MSPLLPSRLRRGVSNALALLGFAVPLLPLPLSAADAPKKRVVTTFTILADMARNVAGDRADVESLTKIGAEIHGYEPTPQDIVKAQKADLVLWNGLNLEVWFEKFYGNLNGVPRAILTSGITPMSVTEGPYSGKPNPHAWMSPSNALVYVENIRKALASVDPANAAAYAANAAAYSNQIRALDAPLRSALDILPDEQRWLITSEGAFSYLCRDYKLKEGYLWAINADSQGTPQQVQKVIEIVRKNKVPAVFTESTVSDKAARQVAKEAGVRFGGVLFVDSLTDEAGPAPTYLRLIDRNALVLIRGLMNRDK